MTKNVYLNPTKVAFGKKSNRFVVFWFILTVHLFVSMAVYSQKQRFIFGKIVVTDRAFANVTVKNLSNNAETKTNSNGDFTLEAQVNDTLLCKAIGLENVKVVVQDANLKNLKISIIMTQKATELEEVVINQYPNINAVSLGIIPNKIETLTTNERRLKTAGDFKPIHLLALLGGTLPFDPILNKINGKTKKLKEYIEIEQKEANLLFLRENFTHFMTKDLAMSSENIERIFYFAIEDQIFTELMLNKNLNQIRFYLCELKFKFGN